MEKYSVLHLECHFQNAQFTFLVKSKAAMQLVNVANN